MKKKVLFILIPIFVLLLVSIIVIAVENYKAKDIVYDKTPYENTSVSYNSYGKPTKFKVYDSSKELIKEIKLSSLFALADEKIVYRNKDKFYILDTSNGEIKKLGNKKLIKCIDCGKEVVIESRSRSQRCETCQKAKRNEDAKNRMQKMRSKKNVTQVN